MDGRHVDQHPEGVQRVVKKRASARGPGLAASTFARLSARQRRFLNDRGQLSSVEALLDEERYCMFATREENWRRQGYRKCKLAMAVKRDFGTPVPITSIIKDDYNNVLKEVTRPRPYALQTSLLLSHILSAV
ncbi:hypothetical protein KIPB_000319 [Kipferlia bialata]|uniref:Uncharacterized protein n=1 Tax=Kipferlia bialata TaxID=797122 RepID=A0A9K3GEE5_9EUKA|nr:hypothetical protein KIPB_000319 [Kipferlia bialata]|eukprot:g319.t1